MVQHHRVDGSNMHRCPFLAIKQLAKDDEETRGRLNSLMHLHRAFFLSMQLQATGWQLPHG